VEIRIRDNGTGIPAEVQQKMFNPFSRDARTDASSQCRTRSSQEDGGQAPRPEMDPDQTAWPHKR
jgi:signal transduction histidine kinase